MPPTLCDLLDDYLDGDLDAATANRFARHVDDCDACRTAVQIADRVRTALRAEALPLPESLHAEPLMERAVSSARRRTRWWLGGAMAAPAAAVLIAALALHAGSSPESGPAPESDWVGPAGPRTPTDNGMVADDSPLEVTPVAEPVRKVEANFAPGVIPVQLEAQNENVTIFVLYPTSPATERVTEDPPLP